jgi:hypothetical protein
VELCTNRYVNKWEIANWKEGQKTEITGRSSLRGRGFALDCSAIEEEEEEENGEEEDEGEEGGGGEEGVGGGEGGGGEGGGGEEGGG